MAESVSVQQLLGSGVLINPHEAVAIVQQLLQTERADTGEGAIGADEVVLGANGQVRCEPCAAPSEADIGWLLEKMLPAGVGVRVPGALRVTIARACGAIAAPPFGSLAALSAALDRFEQGDRRDVVRQLMTRGGIRHPPPALNAEAPPALNPEEDRRRRGTSRSQLRRDLREADALLFTLLAALDAPPTPASQTGLPSRRRARYVAAFAALPLSFVLGYGATGLIGHWRVPNQTDGAIASHPNAGGPSSSEATDADEDAAPKVVGMSESTSERSHRRGPRVPDADQGSRRSHSSRLAER